MISRTLMKKADVDYTVDNVISYAMQSAGPDAAKYKEVCAAYVAYLQGVIAGAMKGRGDFAISNPASWQYDRFGNARRGRYAYSATRVKNIMAVYLELVTRLGYDTHDVPHLGPTHLHLGIF